MSVFQLLIADTSFDPDLRGIRAFSYDDENRHLSHPLPMGGVVWTRDLSDPHGTEYLVEIEAVEKDGWPVPFWVYYLRPTDPLVKVADLAVAADCTVEDLLGR